MARRDTKFGRARLEAPPRRTAGQHSIEQMEHLLSLTAVPWLTVAIMALVVAGLEWYRITDPTPHPIAYSLVAAGFCIFAIAKIRRSIRHAQRYALGAEGERSVADMLHDLGRFGYVALHDIDTGMGNIDHVLVGPGGVFAIETKTRTKTRAQGKNQIRSNGEVVSINDGPFDDAPVRQARRNATWLGTHLREAGERDLYVIAALLYPEWWVESESGDGCVGDEPGQLLQPSPPDQRITVTGGCAPVRR